MCCVGGCGIICATLSFDETPLDMMVFEGWSETEMPPKGADPGGPCGQGLALSFARAKAAFCGRSQRLRGLTRETGCLCVPKGRKMGHLQGQVPVFLHLSGEGFLVSIGVRRMPLGPTK